MSERARHSSVLRPRWGRIGAVASSVVVTLVAVLGGVGILPSGGTAAASSHGRSGAASLVTSPTVSAPSADDLTAKGVPITPTPSPSAAGASGSASSALPSGSGTGKRVVFDISGQRVWLVTADGRVARTYPVSGSLTDNLQPGTYAVYSTSRWATGVDDSGVMQYFVRFTHGARAAIGFHSVPTKNGHLLETRGELGTPQSHGCIRQWLPDAKALWDFAPVGTKVVVTA
jgi:lipoprotein-anchoring transpeptidase ErfK/SrfK